MESIHLTDYPVASDTREDAALRDGTRFARQAVKLGQKLREQEKLKVRQPLKSATVVSLADGNKEHFERFAHVISEELNVMECTFSDNAAEFVDFEVLPNFGVLGPKLRGDLPKAKKALATLDGSSAYAQMQSAGSLTLDLEGGSSVELTPEEVEVRIKPKEGLTAESSGDAVVILDTELNDELVEMGLAREVVNRIQGSRRELDLEYTSRINVKFTTEHANLAEVIAVQADYIKGETLTLEIVEATPSGDTFDTEIDGASFSYSVEVSS